MAPDEVRNKAALSVEFDQKDLQEAFEKQWFKVYYQPKVSIEQPDKVVGLEVFTRVLHPQHGIIYQALLQPLLLQSGQCLTAMRVILDQIDADLTQWNQRQLDYTISINVDLETLQSEAFQALIETHYQANPLLKNHLYLEVDSSDKALWSEATINSLKQLRRTGIKIALDNYKANPSVGNMISDLPVDEVKINRQSISEVGLHDNAKTTIQAVIETAHTNDIKVTALGVENRDCLEWLRENNCDYAQGYHFSKPLDGKTFFDFYIAKSRTRLDSKNWVKPTVLLVEPNEQYRELIADSLSELFEFNFTTGRLDTLAVINRITPDVLIIESNIKNDSGFEIYEAVKQLLGSEPCPILFLSEKDSPEERIAAFRSGALDYIPKPFSVNELTTKIHLVTALKQQRKELVKNIEDEKSDFKTTRSEAVLYASLIHFYRGIMQCSDEYGLRTLLFEFLEKKGLQSSVQFRGPKSTLTFDQRGIDCSPVEVNLFNVLLERGRLFEFNGRMIINYDTVSCLIKRMPTDNDEAGIARDYLAIIIEGIETRFADLIRQRTVNEVLDKLKSLATKLSDAIKLEVDSKNKLLSSLELELQMSFHVLDLTDEQEESITTIIRKMIESTNDGEDRTLDTIEHIEKIVNELSDVAAASQLNKQGKEYVDDSVEFF